MVPVLLTAAYVDRPPLGGGNRVAELTLARALSQLRSEGLVWT
jgi:hypothetical protein